MVARTVGQHLDTEVQLVVHELRAAPALGLEQHPDPPRAGLGRVAAQGVLAGEVRGEVEVDVRAGIPRGESGNRPPRRAQGDDAVGGNAPVDDRRHYFDLGVTCCARCPPVRRWVVDAPEGPAYHLINLCKHYE